MWPSQRYGEHLGFNPLMTETYISLLSMLLDEHAQFFSVAKAKKTFKPTFEGHIS